MERPTRLAPVGRPMAEGLTLQPLASPCLAVSRQVPPCLAQAYLHPFGHSVQGKLI